MITAVAWLLLAWPACDPAETCALAARVEPSLVLGQGETAFEPLEAGGWMRTEHGPQGGIHVWGALRATGIDPGAYRLVGEDGAPRATIRVVDAASGREIAVGRIADVPWTGDHRQAEIVGIRAVLEGVTDEVDDTGSAPEPETLLKAEVTDACGTKLAEEIAIRLGG